MSFELNAKKHQMNRDKSTLNRIFLSPPHMSGEEISFVREAFEGNYIAPVGPMVDAFEQEFAEYVGIRHCLALSSGTAAMHLESEFSN
jgi:dTDP-4-amino-4,6-dideoxygalactose transaminase